MNEIRYIYRGPIERWAKRKPNAPISEAVWKNGYSEQSESGGTLYPWMTKAECRQDANSRNAKAVFVRE